MHLERAQRDLVNALLTHLCELGLISKAVCSGAMEQVCSTWKFPEPFWNRAYPEEADRDERTSGPQ